MYNRAVRTDGFANCWQKWSQLSF